MIGSTHIRNKRSHEWTDWLPVPFVRRNPTHLYVAQNGLTSAPYIVSVFDYSRLVASNYAGGGVWTLDPKVADIVVGGIRRLNFTKNGRILAGQGTTVQFIDCDVNSPTFNTVVGTINGIDYSGGNIRFNTLGAYDPVRDIHIFGGDNTVSFFRGDNFRESDVESWLRSRIMEAYPVYPATGFIQYSPVHGGMILHHAATTTIGYRLRVRDELVARNEKEFSFLSFRPGGENGTGYVTLFGKFAAIALRSQLDVFDLVNNRGVVQITSANNMRQQGHYSLKNSKLVIGSIDGNRGVFVNTNNWTIAASPLKAAPDTSEVGSTLFHGNEDTAVCFPSNTGSASTKFRRMHVWDMAANTYVGYYDFPANSLPSSNDGLPGVASNDFPIPFSNNWTI